MNLLQLAADLLCFVFKYKMVAVAMLNVIFVRFYGTSLVWPDKAFVQSWQWVIGNMDQQMWIVHAPGVSQYPWHADPRWTNEYVW